MVAGSLATITMLKQAGGPDWLAARAVPHLWVDDAGHSGGCLGDHGSNRP